MRKLQISELQVANLQIAQLRHQTSTSLSRSIYTRPALLNPP